MTDQAVVRAYDAARGRYAALGVDVDAALRRLDGVSLSLPCWQADDVGGFERVGATPGGGLAVTGRRAGRPRTADELRLDLEAAFGLVPGHHRLNLHAIYGEWGGRPPERDRLGPDQFTGWMQWAFDRGIRLDFNATCFSHPLADDGATLTHEDAGVRRYWIDHCRAARRVAAEFGRRQGEASTHNLWIPDGSKEAPTDRAVRRERLLTSLDEVFAQRHDPSQLSDAVEGKLFGIGSESFVAGSHEFYLAYALTRGVMVCLDTGHYHPTESVADKISALLPFVPGLLLHLSRGVRWDSDHVPLCTDETRAILSEVVRAGALGRVRLALDFFDGSLNRPGALALGARAVLVALLAALLEPIDRLRAFEGDGDRLAVLALVEEARALPLGAVWDHWCLAHNVPVAEQWIAVAQAYERRIVDARR